MVVLTVCSLWISPQYTADVWCSCVIFLRYLDSSDFVFLSVYSMLSAKWHNSILTHRGCADTDKCDIDGTKKAELDCEGSVTTARVIL